MSDQSSGTTVQSAELTVDREAQLPSDLRFVSWDGPDDPKNPRNFSLFRKMMITVLVAQISFCLTANSSISSTAALASAKEFGVNEYLGDMATGLYFIGFGVGVTPIGPLSEIYGRNIVYLPTFLAGNLLTIGCSLAPNIQTLLVCRFLGGVFGAAPLCNSGGTLSDIADAHLRSWLFPFFSTVSYIGPCLAPTVGSFIASSHLGWRWVYWVTFIYSMGIWCLCLFFLPETNAAVILKRKAAKVRKQTGDDRHQAEHKDLHFSEIVSAVCMPIKFLATEPIVLFCNAYITIIYLVFFGDLETYDTVFREPYGITQGQVGLMFLPVTVGVILSGVTTPFVVWQYRRICNYFGTSAPPEVRIIPMLLVSPLIPISLFWIGWTSFPSISLWCPGVSGLVFGFAFLFLFMQIYLYLIDTYEANAATALASITLARYWASGVWVIFVRQIFRDMGFHWAYSMLAFLSVAMIPVTYIFFKYGRFIRKRSRYATVHGVDEKLKKIQMEKLILM